MEGNPEPVETRPTRVSRMVRAAREWLTASPRHVGYVVVLAALLLTVPFGGLAAVPQDELPVTPAGEEVGAAPWRMTWERALHGPDLGGAFGPQEGTTHVLLVGRISTTADETVPVSDLRHSIVLRTGGLVDSTGREVEVGGAPSVVYLYGLEPTPQPLTGVSPGLTYPVGLHLTMPASATVPGQIEVELLGKTRRRSSLEGVEIWTDEVPVSTVSVPTEASGPVFESVWSLAP